MDTNLFRYVWRHSRREQILILLLILASMPFYFASLDIPRLIVNDAIQGHAFGDGKTTAKLFAWTVTLPNILGGGNIVISDGFDVDQVTFLMALSLVFLALVLINGAFKYVINIRKGVLGERVLRRMRFELFDTLLRFRPEDIRTVKPSEATSMIKDEVEPIGAFVGDAFIQPAYLGAQALTALAFILLQSLWLGMIALTIVLVQAFVIPWLRREQIRLGRERQIAARHLAGRIGEVIETAPAVHIHGTAGYDKSEIGHRLGNLFDIRVALFKRKFAVKYLNNLLAQVTPFFFYAIGGYFALKGSLDIGQLVAVIAAYRDLPPPIKELIDWDQQRNDVTVKYEQIVSQFTADELLPLPGDENPEDLKGPITIDGLRVVDRRGSPLLDASVTIVQPSHVALVGTAGSGRDILAKVLGRQITEYEGLVRVGQISLKMLSDEAAGRLLAYAGPEPLMLSGTIRDNVAYSLRRIQPADDDLGEEDLSATHRRRREEAVRSGNPLAHPESDWFDYTAAGVSDHDALDTAILDALEVGGMKEEIYSYGLNGKLGSSPPPNAERQLIEARHAVYERLSAERLNHVVETFDPARYNINAAIGENLLFGVPVGNRLSSLDLAADPYLRTILEAEALVEPLTELGLRIGEFTAEMFADLPPGHPLFERYSFIRSNEMEQIQKLIDIARQRGGKRRLPTGGRTRLIALALGYIEPRHRLNLLNDTFNARILRARASFKRYLPRDYADRIEFYDPDKIMTAAPIRDNILFGRIAFESSNAERKVWTVVRETLASLELEPIVYRLGLDTEVGPGGRLLHAPQRAAINLARCLVKHPEILVLDGALSTFGQSETRAIMKRLREALHGQTLIATMADASEAEGFDAIIQFDGPHMKNDHQPTAAVA
ncbi:ABC transporter transmembrane domain-containing protein [Leptospira interrogans]